MDRDFSHSGASDFSRSGASDFGSGHTIEHGNSNNGGEEGFFEIPNDFPTLMSLGAGFESMKIPRYKEIKLIPQFKACRGWVPYPRTSWIYIVLK